MNEENTNYGSPMCRSTKTGLWYHNPFGIAFSPHIDAVELYGERLFREENEQNLPWVCRVSEWASALHSENDTENNMDKIFEKAYVDSGLEALHQEWEEEGFDEYTNG